MFHSHARLLADSAELLLLSPREEFVLFSHYFHCPVMVCFLISEVVLFSSKQHYNIILREVEVCFQLSVTSTLTKRDIRSACSSEM